MTMDFDNDSSELRSAHVIVVGNEKGGAGKSTISIHLTVALLKAGYRVASIDLDTRQQTLTRFFENRQSWAASANWPIELPHHRAMGRGASSDVRANEASEFADFAEAIGAVEHDFEFVVIDTPASDSYLMRLAHSLADTLVSPLNDSYIDVDVFSRVNHDRKQRGAVAHYADLVLEARRKRQLVDNGVIDWVMVRNRMASLANNNARQIAISIARLGAELRFRVADGFHDRVIFRELFPIGLTALDAIEQGAQKGALTSSQLSAREEIERLLEALELPTRAPGLNHLECRRLWHARVSDMYRGRSAATQ
ncbi:MAG: division plane positioning ATPase MipZ [Roseiarcus sp.]|jgi:chromosome partitioning protein